MKLWDKGFDNDKRIDAFTVGKDRELDLQLAPFDILGTIAHATMLTEKGLLTDEELSILKPALQELYRQAEEGRFSIDPDVEDIHSQVELSLTKALGDAGKKIHSGRSRNDQVLLDVKLFIRSRIERTVGKAKALFDILQEKSEASKDILMPGYTHLQVAMPSSFGLWFGAYAESIADDMILLKAAWDVADQNPLGSAAGYGSSAPIDRKLTTALLGFADMDYNSICAQMGRGKTERIVAMAYTSLAETLGRFAMDCCLYNSQNFGFIRLPDSLTSGSSIMPHKKNPDVFELVRAHCNRIQGIPETIRHICSNLPSGYFRDLQITKEVFFPLFDEMDDCLDILAFATESIEITPGIMDKPLYQSAFSVEEVNRRVGEGVPFREAYKQVGHEILDGTFHYEGTPCHTHEGSLGNLCNKEIRSKMDRIIGSFPFGKVRKALDALAGKD